MEFCEVNIWRKQKFNGCEPWTVHRYFQCMHAQNVAKRIERKSSIAKGSVAKNQMNSIKNKIRVNTIPHAWLGLQIFRRKKTGKDSNNAARSDDMREEKNRRNIY